MNAFLETETLTVDTVSQSIDKVLARLALSDQQHKPEEPSPEAPEPKLRNTSTKKKQNKNICPWTRKTSRKKRQMNMRNPNLTEMNPADEVSEKKDSNSNNYMEEESFNWNELLITTKFDAVPVSCFHHVPLGNSWKRLVQIGTKVETELLIPGIIERTRPDEKLFWVASILEFRGYKVRIRYAGFCEDDSADRWVNFCTGIFPPSHCYLSKLPLVPPRDIPLRPIPYDWRMWLIYSFKIEHQNLKRSHQQLFTNSLKSRNSSSNIQYEVLNKICISQMRVATLTDVIGRRLQFSYWNTDKQNKHTSEFWVHEDSHNVYPLGWSKTVGHDLCAPENYSPPNLSESEIFKIIGKSAWPKSEINVGMRLEAVDPLDLSRICAARVVKVLKFDYFMIQIDSIGRKLDPKDAYCYHITNPLIFECGFCETHEIRLGIPLDVKSRRSFDWNLYLKDVQAKPLKIQREEYTDHGFEVGMKLEAADVMNPKLVAVATIAGVYGRLLKIHFDGWENSYDQYHDACSPDLFPIGWCEAVGHKLEPPKPKARRSSPMQALNSKEARLPS